MNSYVLRNLLIWMPNFAESVCRKVDENWATLSQFDDSDIQIQTLYYWITEAYPVLIHCWVADSILLLCWSTACFITLLSYPTILHWCAIPNPNTLLRYTLSFYIAEQFLKAIITEPYPILTHCWGIPYLITLLSNSQKLIHCWATPNRITLLRHSLFCYIAEYFPTSLHTELYPILIHCWCIPNFDTLLR